MNLHLKIFIRIVILALSLVVMHFIYQQWFYETDLQEQSEIINRIREVQQDAEVVYLAESSNKASRSDDVDKRGISEMIAEYYPSVKLNDISRPAAHAGMYYAYLQQIAEDSPVKTVIVTLNMRSFNGQWIFSNLETPLQKEIVLLKDYPDLLNRFLLSFKGYDIKNEKEREKQFKRMWRKNKMSIPQGLERNTVTKWDGAMFHGGIKNPDGSKNWEETSLACHYIKAYAFQIDFDKNPRIKDFDAIAKLAKKRNWNLVFNLMAENVDKAQEYVGDELLYLMNENRQKLVDRYTKMGVLVVDNLDNVRDDQFMDQHWTTEHYAQQGRQIIAKNVADSLKNIYPNDYKQVSYPSHIPQRTFFNDCEKPSSWGQTKTISSEKACSGAKSSKVGGGNPYSLTFERYMVFIPDTLMNSVDISLNVFQKELEPNSKLVVEISGYKSGLIVARKSLTELTNEIGNWQEISYTYKIPDQAKKGTLFKVYVYNPNQTAVFVDDLKITFN